MINTFTTKAKFAYLFKLFSFVLLCLIITNPGSELAAQDQIYDKRNSANNLFEIENSFNEHWKGKSPDQGEGFKPMSRWIHNAKNNIDKEGNILPAIHLKDMDQLFRQLDDSPSLIKHMWNPIGPLNAPDNGIGRVTDIENHPSEPNRFYTAAPSGGLWISDDACASWYTTTDKLAQIGLSKIEINPSDPNQIIIAADNGGPQENRGLIRSIDRGLSWDYMPMIPVDCGEDCELDYAVDLIRIRAIYWHKTDPDVIIVAGFSGLHKTTDGGASWSRNPNLRLRDMQVNPTNPDVLYGYDEISTACYVSNDVGENWTQVSLPNNGNIIRAAIAVSPDEPNSVYLAAAVGSGHRLFKSIDQGNSYTEIFASEPINLGNQSGYNWAFTVDPNDAETMYLGGVSMFKSTDGGINWERALCDQSCIHVDFHYLGFLQGSLYAGNDGGVYRKSEGSYWEELNNGLQITQFYRCSVSETDSVVVMAGAQDNGTHNYYYKWKKIFGADGMDNAIDPNDEDLIYYSAQNGSFFKSTNQGQTWVRILGSHITGTSGEWVTPFMIHPNSSNILYAGYRRLWKSDDYGANWYYTSPGIISSNSHKMNYFDIAENNPNVILALTRGELHKSTDGGSSWSQLTIPIYGVWIEIDPSNEDHIWICGSQQILKSEDGGQNWQDVTWNIPEGININTIVRDKDTNGHIYVGTMTGVWYSDETLNEWIPFNNLLPNVNISELKIAESFNKIRASTYGRGLWESYTVDHYACYDSLLIENVLDAGIYHASKNVSSDAVKLTNTQSQLIAGESIDLLPQFEIKIESTFSAFIEECPEQAKSYHLPFPTGNYCESSVEINDLIGLHQVDLTSRESHWFNIDSDYRYFVNILSCGGGANTTLKIYAGDDCDIFLQKEVYDFCSSDDGNGQMAAGVHDFLMYDYNTYYLEWSVEDVEKIWTCSQVNSSFDDAEERQSSGEMYMNSSDLELVRDSENQLVGLLFKDIDVPQGVDITSAHIQFSTDETSEEETTLTFKAEAVDNATSFVDVNGNISSRITTQDSVNWTLYSWPLEGERGVGQRTPDLSSIIDEITSRPGYTQLNNIAIIISGTGKRTAEAFDGSALEAAELCITYEVPLISSKVFEFEITIADSVGYYCELATPVDPTDRNFSDLHQDGGTSNTSARWYTYIPAQSGTIDISSCINVFDTNLIFWEGECQNKTILYQNSGVCSSNSEETNAAALFDIPVTANQIYLIEWNSQDNKFFVDFEFIENF